MKYVELIYEDIKDEAVLAAAKQQMGSMPMASTIGFTDAAGGVRYRIYRDRRTFEKENLRAACQTIDAAKGAEIPLH